MSQQMPGKFRDWVRAQIYRDPKDKGEILRFAIRHLNAGRKDMADIESFPVPKGDDLTEETPDQLAFKMWEAACSDANGLTGVNNYAFIVFRSEDPSNYTARFVWRFVSEDEVEEEKNDGLTEPATKQGLLSQLMRHNEAMMRGMTVGTQQIITSLQRQNEALARTVELATKNQVDQVQAVQELYDRKQERDLERIREESAYALKQELWGDVKPLLPVILKRLTGAKMLGSGKKDEALKTILGSFKVEQFEKLQEILNPQQLAMLSELMMEVQAEQEERTKMLPNGGAEH